MSTYTIVALVVLPILGGFIAWFGDVLGYRLGKSRRSLFGLRPRATARVIVVAVGVILPLLTMFVAAVGSQNVRVALFELTQLQASRQQLSEENQRLQTSVKVAMKETAAAQEQTAAARRAYTRAVAQLETAQRRVVTAQRQVSTAEARAREARSRLKGTQEALTTTQQRLAASQAKLQATDRSLRQAQAEEQALRKQVAALQEQVSVLQLQASQARAEAESARRFMDQARRQLEQTQEELQRTQERVREAQIQATTWLGQGLFSYMISAAGRVRYEQGEELVRSFVTAGDSERQIESSLGELLVLASAKAVAKGAPINPETGRAVLLVAPLPADSAEIPPPEEQVIRAVAREIKTARAPIYVVSLRVVFRSFTEDTDPNHPVAVGFVAHPNVLVYPADTVIVREEIDGSRPRAEIFQQILGILADLRTAAQQAGILPDPETGQYGQVPGEELLATLDEIIARQGRTTVEAVAAERVYVASGRPFVVRLRVAQAEG